MIRLRLKKETVCACINNSSTFHKDVTTCKFQLQGCVSVFTVFIGSHLSFEIEMWTLL